MIYPVSEDEIRTNHLRDGEGECPFSLHGDKLARFAAIKELCNPGGLTPADTEAIELITGADKSQEAVSQLSKLLSKLLTDHKRVRRNRQDFRGRGHLPARRSEWLPHAGPSPRSCQDL